MKNLLLTGALSVLTLTACKKDDTTTAQKSLEQEKLEFQAKQLEIEKQKFAIEKEKIAFEKAKDSIAKVEKEKQASIAANNKPQIIRETRTIYKDAPRASSNSNSSYANNSGYESQPAQKQGMSKAAKGTIIGTVGGAAAGAIINKKNRGVGAVIGGVVGGATGYTIGRSKDRKDGRVQ